MNASSAMRAASAVRPAAISAVIMRVRLRDPATPSGECSSADTKSAGVVWSPRGPTNDRPEPARVP